jgi:ferrochelatase
MTETARRDRWAVVLVNLGTPEAPTPSAVRRYLGEFLWDPRVVDLPRPVWWLVLHLFVLPFRSRKSARAYRAIWTERGSPLLGLSRDLTAALGRELAGRSGNRIVTGLAMRYGQPALRKQLDDLRADGIDRFLILPLYPQYSSPSTGSVFDALASVLRGWRHVPEVRFVGDYHDHPAYIAAVADRVGRFWNERGRGRFLLFSFHGLPERSRAQGDPYYDQCLTSARLIADRLQLADDAWQAVFQSRFGPQQWLQPYCIDVLRALPERGIREVDIVCPGFAVDCLETLEEIGIANKKAFLEAGGTRYRLIPALNDSPEQVRALAELVWERLG